MKLLHSVVADNYQSDYYVVSDSLYSFKRIHHRTISNKETDVFPDVWSFVIGDFPPGRIAIRRDSKTIYNKAPMVAFLPKYSLVEWQVASGTYEWIAYFSSKDLSLKPPSEAIAFDWDGKYPNSLADIEASLATARNSFPISPSSHLSAVGLKTKSFIEKSFSSELTIEEIAKQLGYSHSVMSRMFKRDFGISPLEYRNKLRLFTSHKLLLFNGENATSAGLECGFSDISRFNKQFRKRFNTTPSRFKPTT